MTDVLVCMESDHDLAGRFRKKSVSFRFDFRKTQSRFSRYEVRFKA